MIQKFVIGSFTIDSYNAMFLVGCVFFIILLCAHRKVYNFAFWKALIMALISIPLGYATTSLLFAFEYGISEMNFSGFSWYGAVFFMPLCMIILSPIMKHILKINARDYINNLAAPLALMNGFMKLGCFFYGCCYGFQCSWGFYNSLAGTNVFPIQLIECIWNFTVCGFILWYERRPNSSKNVYPMYMIVYSIGRIFCEFGRAVGDINFKPLFGVIKGGMIYAAIAICIGAFWISQNKKNDAKLAKATAYRGGKDGWRQHK